MRSELEIFAVQQALNTSKWALSRFFLQNYFIKFGVPKIKLT